MQRFCMIACDIWEMQERENKTAASSICLLGERMWSRWGGWSFLIDLSPGIPNFGAGCWQQLLASVRGRKRRITRWLRWQVNDKPCTVNNDRVPCYIYIYTHAYICMLHSAAGPTNNMLPNLALLTSHERGCTYSRRISLCQCEKQNSRV